MSRRDEIRSRLEAAFQPEQLEVIDDSHLHAGHAGHSGSGESHFTVHIRAQAFAGQSRIARHRAVHKALGAELVGQIHALALKIEA